MYRDHLKRPSFLTTAALGAICGGVFCVGPFVPLSAQERGRDPEQAAANATIHDAAWMAGCWLAEGPDARDEEVWLAPAAGMMLGMARSVRGGRLVSVELATLWDLSVGERPEEGLVFVARPSGQDGAEFRVVTLVPNGMRVENPDHDFPQAIEYLRTSRDSLVARVFGDADDTDPAFQILYARNNC
jgi:hypothetical protein